MTLRALILCAVSTEAQAKDDKISMEQQERDAVAKCELEGWDVIDIIRIPGYSRSFYTLRELAEQSLADNEPGPARLEEHIKKADFDMLVVRSTNRFNREQSLNAEIIGRVVKQCAARIFSFSDGFIDINNYRSIAAITGYRDSHEIDELVRRRADGIVRRSQKGLTPSGKPPMSHRLVRNPATGKAERLEVREEYRPLWNDLATLILEGVAYERLSGELFTRWGYSDANGRPYDPTKFYVLLLNPVFWGNNAIRWRNKVHKWARGRWVLDASEPPPPGVEMFYNTHEAVYTGELATRIKAELRRRQSVFNGASAGSKTKKFSGLVVCLECKWRYTYTLVTSRGKKFTYLRCNKANKEIPRRGTCSQKTMIREKEVQAWVSVRLAEWVESGLVTLTGRPQKNEAHQAVRDLKESEKKLKRRLEAFMDELGESEPDLRDEYRKKIRSAKDELLRCQNQLMALEYEAEHERRADTEQQITLERIRQMGVPAFWEQDNLTINQMLMSLLGDSRMLAIDGEIVSFGDVKIFGF